MPPPTAPTIRTPEAMVADVLAALTTSPAPMTEFERGFLYTLNHQTTPLRPGQRQVLVQLAEQYLDASLAAELRGQQRLFP